ncbi:MAG TPA: GGDEF domain-containing protein [Paucimonas sp.]|nr:GGDEF domain-containing protein [Paucimonas sp.]
MHHAENNNVIPDTDIFAMTGEPLLAAELAGEPLLDSFSGAAGARIAHPHALHETARHAMRFRRLQLSFVFAGLYLVALAVFHWQGLIDRPTFAIAAALLCGATAVFYGLFIGGTKRKIREWNLSAPIALCSIAIMLWLTYAAPATRIIFAPFIFATIACCMYRLRQRAVLMLCVGTLAGYAAVIGLHHLRLGAGAAVDAAMLRQDLLHWFVLALTLPSFVLLTGRLQRLQGALRQAGMRIRNIEEHARRDPLTNSYNRRYMVTALEEQKRYADGSGAPLCLAVIDLDHFKRINDEVGHLAGDDVLRTFVAIAQRNVRETDIFGRYGGEEFLLVLPNTSLLEAFNIAERLRERVERHDWHHGLRQPVTVSIGLTQYISGESVLELFSRTDTAMYLAKRGGRNQVVAEEPAAGLWQNAD